MKKPPPRFFCEQCGTEVGMGVAACPVCGNKFGSVRCPQCGVTALAAQFKNGCPNCNYGQTEEESPRPVRSRRASKKRKNTSALPLWLYALTVAVAAAFIILLLITVK
jgi:uncharacterized membrane protein YvbJ